jgi:ankyrin repeat protein
VLLAEPSIDINAKDRNYATPLWWATRGNYENVAARLLAEPNADINTVGQFETPSWTDQRPFIMPSKDDQT